MVRLHGGPDRIRLKTFLIRSRLGVLPAFSSLAGGFDVERGAGTQLYPIADGRVFEL
jgi:metallophosphoesterase superfamily enzyme